MWGRFLPPFYHFGGAFRPHFMILTALFAPQIVKVGALSAPTQDMLLKYSLDLPYMQTEVWRSVTIGSKRYSSEIQLIRRQQMLSTHCL